MLVLKDEADVIKLGRKLSKIVLSVDISVPKKQ